MTKFSRRDFLRFANRIVLTIGGLLGAGALSRFFGYRSETDAPTEFHLGAADLYPLGSRTVLADVPAMLVHGEDGFYALSLTCTHLGCTLEDEQEQLSCPCHGSLFDARGRVLQGPAESKLPELRVEVRADGQVILRLQ
jgi:nitrite reductase/ring-hydroxylating ferredoxin subunit